MVKCDWPYCILDGAIVCLHVSALVHYIVTLVYHIECIVTLVHHSECKVMSYIGIIVHIIKLVPP